MKNKGKNTNDILPQVLPDLPHHHAIEGNINIQKKVKNIRKDITEVDQDQDIVQVDQDIVEVDQDHIEDINIEAILDLIVEIVK